MDSVINNTKYHTIKSEIEYSNGEINFVIYKCEIKFPMEPSGWIKFENVDEKRKCEQEQIPVKKELEIQTLKSLQLARQLITLEIVSNKIIQEIRNKVWSCFDLFSIICTFLFPIEQIGLLYISKIWNQQTIHFFERIEATLLPKDSVTCRRIRFSTVCQWIQNLGSILLDKPWPKDFNYHYDALSLWKKDLQKRIPKGKAEWLRIWLQNDNQVFAMKTHLLTLCISNNLYIEHLKVLLEEKANPNVSSEMERSPLDLCFTPKESWDFNTYPPSLKLNPIDLEKVELLLQHGAVAHHNHLVKASQTNQIDLIKLLLHGGCNPFELIQTTTYTVFNDPKTSKEAFSFYQEEFLVLAQQFKTDFFLELKVYNGKPKVVFCFLKHLNHEHWNYLPIPPTLALVE